MSTNTGMQGLIQIVNRLQDAFSQLGQGNFLDLPQIAVVGGQSAGKSSVLENFVGKDFLPRGSGIVTRRPLILQLNNSDKEYGEFTHCRGKIFTSFDEIRAEIEAETDRMTGQNKGISNIPINLHVWSPYVLNLTLIDLPGLTKVAVGDQPVDIEQQIHSMIMEFITSENTIILAVTPANSDLANSDALKLAKEVDPSGSRTIGVITKLDLMDDGTDARPILDNELLPLKRGYIGVVNRSQKDIVGNKDIRAALAAEKQFFSSHASYRHLGDKCGTPYLQKVLNQQLTNHIRDVLPELKSKLNKQLLVLEPEIDAFKHFETGKGDRGSKTKALMQMINTFGADFESQIDGTSTITTSLQGGAKIARIFQERYPFDVQKLELDERSFRKQIAFAIKNTHGARCGLFTPNLSFDLISQRMIQRLLEPTTKCVDLVSHELHELVGNITEPMGKFPKLREETERAVNNHIKQCETATKQWVKDHIGMQMCYMNTSHPDFLGNLSGDQRQSGNNLSTNQVVRKGWLTITQSGVTNMFGSKDYWFVLTAETLSWYKDEEEDEQKFLLPLEGLKMEVADDQGIRRRKNTFKLFNPNKKFVYKDHTTLDLTAATPDEVDDWQASFLRAGVYPVLAEQDDEQDVDDVAALDPQLERQVETLRNYVDAYMSIVNTTMKDQVPKAIMLLLVSAVKEFIKGELFSDLFRECTTEELMEESAAEEERRKELLAMYSTCKEALKIIGDVKLTKIDVAPPASARPAPAPSSRPTPAAPSRPTTSSRPTPPQPSSRPVPPQPRSRPTSGGPPAPAARQPPMPSRPNVPSRPTPSTPSRPNVPSRP
eukprot:m.41213 g.41213  ORF g.41213 m.41213 type:complete len:829 (+) comp11438_c1_seq2:158-2644(+)